jgi:NurA-like 5'-3' nuclease
MKCSYDHFWGRIRALIKKQNKINIDNESNSSILDILNQICTLCEETDEKTKETNEKTKEETDDKTEEESDKIEEESDKTEEESDKTEEETDDKTKEKT